MHNAGSVAAYQPQAATSREDALDPTPIAPGVDPNIDLFINDYKNSQPRMISN